MRYREDFQEPVSLDNINRFTHYREFGSGLICAGNANLSYPISVWRRDIATFYTLGGFDTVRGYPKNSIGAFRYLLLSADLEYPLMTRIWADLPEFLTLDLTLTRIRLLALADGLLSQDSLDVRSPIYGFVNVGFGLSFVFVEGKKRHYTLRIYVAQALLQRMKPMFYLSLTSSRFKVRESLEL
jgi:hypothetical protein